MSDPSKVEVDSTNKFVQAIPEEMYEQMVRCDLIDGSSMEVRFTLLTLSNNFLNLWQYNCTENENKQLVFPVQNVEKEIFKLVVDWLEIQILEEKPFDRSSIEVDGNGDRVPIPLNDFQRKFFDDLDFTSHAELIKAADYMDIPSLYTLGAMTIADRMKTMSEEEIRDNFDLEDDLSEQEKDEIRRFNVWCYYR